MTFSESLASLTLTTVPPSVMSSLPALRSLHIGTIFVEPGVHPEADIARHLSSPKLEKFSIEYGLTEPSPRDSRWRILDEVLSPARRPSLQLVLLEIRRRDDHDRLAVVLQEYLPELQNSGRLTIKRAMNA